MQLYKKRILILGKCLDGGTGTFLSLLNSGIKNTIQTYICILEKPSFNKLNEKINYYNHQKSYPDKYSFSTSNILLIFKEIFWLRTQININKPDICFAIDYHSSLLVELYRLLFWDTKIKTILTFHNNLTGVFNDKASNILKNTLLFIGRFLFPRSGQIVGVSKELSNDIKKLFKLKKNPKTVYYGIQIQKKIFKRNILNNKITFLFIARLDRQKDHMTLINAFTQLVQKVKQNKLELLLIGDGDLRLNIKRYISSLHMIEHIKLLGWKKDVNYYLKKSDIFIFSTKREGFGLVLLEAMNFGLPIISNDVDFGPRELLGKNKYGLLVPQKNEEALIKAMEKLITDKELYNYYVKKSFERIKDFSLEKMISQYIKIIKSV